MSGKRDRKTEVMNIRISMSDKAALEVLARRADVSVARLIRDAYRKTYFSMKKA